MIRPPVDDGGRFEHLTDELTVPLRCTHPTRSVGRTVLYWRHSRSISTNRVWPSTIASNAPSALTPLHFLRRPLIPCLSRISGTTKRTPHCVRTGKVKYTKSVVVHSRNLRTPSRNLNVLPGWEERGNGPRPRRARGCPPQPPLPHQWSPQRLRSIPCVLVIVACTIYVIRLMFYLLLWLASIATGR